MYIVIYDQDKTQLYSNAAAASDKIFELYGERFGREACEAVKSGRTGTIYRRHGGPRIEVVTDEKAAWIRKKEMEVTVT